MREASGGTGVITGLGSGTGETRNWIAAIAAVEGRPGTLVDLHPDQRLPDRHRFRLLEAVGPMSSLDCARDDKERGLLIPGCGARTEPGLPMSVPLVHELDGSPDSWNDHGPAGAPPLKYDT